MPKVILNKNKTKKPMPFDVALRKFSKIVEEAGILQKVREKEYYEKPTSKRRRKGKEAVKRQSRLNAENPMNQRNNRKY
jgi:small subunit ribosomal protein S21|tara:strand:- start:343 stop:579 length:237 start_codon:yes stop_codon:yes gene_type:complete